MLAISADDLSQAQKIVEKVGIPFPILYDTEASVISDYDVGGILKGRMADPSTFILDKDGVIRWKYLGGIRDRPDTSTVLEQLKDLAG